MPIRLKNILLICLLILAGANAHAQKQGYDSWGYPVFDSVVSYLSTRVNVDSITEYMRLRLAKKPRGWYLYTADYSVIPERLSEEMKCWDRAKGKYVYEAKKDHTLDKDYYRKQFKKMLELMEARHYYSDEPYFGYVGWTSDVYSLLEGKDKLPDHDINALAYAYGTEAAYRVGYQGNYVPAALSFKLGDYPGGMSSAQIDTIRKYNDLAIRTYKRLWQQNPNYETFVGNVWVKYSNEIMVGFLDLTYLQSAEEGKKRLTTEELYDPATLAFARNLLNSCGKDAILFTQGDNDTYPLHYVQAIEGVRPDVLIVNLNLLSTSIYINAARSGLLGSSCVPMELQPFEYEGSKLDYVKPSDKSYPRFRQVEGIPVTIVRPYLYKNDIALIDILNTNKWKRPICFASSVGSDAFIGLDRYIRYHGFVYQLQTIPSQGSDKDFDTAFNYDFYMDKMAVADWGKQTFSDWNTWAISVNECHVMIKEAQLLKDIGEDKKCLALLNKIMTAFPEGKVKRDFFFIPVPELYYSCGEKTKASMLADMIMQEARKEYNENIKKTDIAGSEWDRNMRGSLYSFQELNSFYTAHSEYEAIASALKKESDDKRKEYEKIKAKKGME